VLQRMERSAQNFVQVVTSSSGARLASVSERGGSR